MKAPDSSSLETAATVGNRTRFQRYGFALLAVAIAFVLRYAFDAGFNHKLFYITFIVATIGASWYGGLGPSLMAFVIGTTLATKFFVLPQNPSRDSTLLDMVLPPVLLQLCIIVFGSSMHRARERADASAREAISHQRQLELEVVERKRAEEEVRQLNMQLEKRVESRTAELVATNQELESFTYSVSHDLRAPLRHIDGFAQVLEEEFGPQMSPEAFTFTQKIRRGSQNMGRLVDDLLNLSRIGKKDLARQHTELTPLAQSVVAEIKLDAPRRKIEWHINPLPVMECDTGLVKQVFMNLLANAVKYTRKREQAVIEVGHKTVNGDTVLYVRDNGVGFNMKYAGKLFGVFQRLHRAEEFEGTGVGLATVARIVRKHGGNIWAEAEMEKGATFYFTLTPAPQKIEAPTKSH